MVAELQSPALIEREGSNTSLTVERYRPGQWAGIRNEVLAIEAAAFGDQGYNEQDEHLLQTVFETPGNINFLLLDEQSRAIVGYTLVELQEHSKTAHIRRIAIIPKEQGRGNVGRLMQVLEAELLLRGTHYLTLDAEVANGYADKVQRHYGNRVIEKEDRLASSGQRRFFRIALHQESDQ